jgi:hypothetical protein
MRKITIDLDEIEFNVFWRSLTDRETKLLDVIEENDEESDEALAANNDIIHIRCIKDYMKAKGMTADFGDEVFSTDEGTIDIAKM